MQKAPTGKILLIEDETAFQNLVKMIVEGQGHPFRGVYLGEEGIKVAKEWKPDLVLLDIHLPDIDGIEVLKQLRANQGKSTLPVVFLTSDKSLKSKIGGLFVGADDYITKPFSAMELLARIRVQLRTKNLQDQLISSNFRLKELEHLRESLTGLIVHDMKNSLAPIQMGIEFAVMDSESKSPSPDRVKQVLQSALQSVQRLGDMISDLLDIGRLEGKQMPMNPKPCEPKALLAECHSQFHLMAEQLGARLTVKSPQNQGRALADRALVRRILANLAGNAIKFADPKGKQVLIGADLAASRKDWIFYVQDNGVGIPKDLTQRVFEKFFRVESDKNSPIPGTGLGLTFCKLAVEAHGGKIWVESEPQKGSRFSFSLKAV